MEMPRFSHHFEPQRGWMNDPNGLVFFKGKYHAFFQHYPHAPRWGQMHWGHAVSEDLIHWEELPVALYPDESYEDDGGCFSGSAVVKDGRLYLFYTSVSHSLGQTQSVAWSDDGIHFTKYAHNPVIRENPLGYPDFRDPKVSWMGDRYHMVVGTGDKNSGKVLVFASRDLLDWHYEGVLFEGAEYAHCIECPDFFRLGEKHVLMFSQIGQKEGAAHFVVGDLVEGRLVNGKICRPEWGIDFYAPQTFLHDGRRIMIGWLYHWGKEPPEGCSFAGALSIPRELTLAGDRILNYPVKEAWHLLKKESDYVKVSADGITIMDCHGEAVFHKIPDMDTIAILEDVKAVEVFVNGGAHSFSRWLV